MYTERKTHEREKVMIWLTWNKSNPYLLPEILNILPWKEKGFKKAVLGTEKQMLRWIGEFVFI